MGNALCCSCSPCSEQNDISKEIKRELEGMQSMEHVEQLIAYIDQFLSNIGTEEQVHISRPACLGSFINSGRNLIEKLSKRLNWHVCKKCVLSALDRQTRKVVFDLINQTQHIPCVGMALSIIAYLLERVEQVSSNTDKCLHLLRYMYALVKHMKNLDIHLGRPKLDEILRFIVKGTLMCALLIQPNSLYRFISAPLDDADLQNLESQLVHSYHDLEFEALTALLDRLPIVPGPTQGEYPRDAVGIKEAQKKLVELLDLQDLSRRVVVIYGVGGIGKTTLATAVFKSLDLTDYHYCRIDMDQLSDLQALQEQILHEAFKESLKLRNFNQGLEKLSEAIGKASKPLFLFIDNAVRHTDVEKLLPMQHLSGLPIRSRILLTTRSLQETQIFQLQGIQVHSYRVDSLSEAEAKKLLCHYALGDKNGSFDGGVNMDGLLQICEGIPLVLKIVGSRLRTGGNTVSACNEMLEYVKEWQRTGLEGGDEYLSERMVDFAYHRLTEPSREAFLDIVFFFYDWKRSQVACIVGEMHLQDLEAAALVTTTEEEEYDEDMGYFVKKNIKVKMHDIVRARGRRLSEGNRITDSESLSILLRDEQKLRQTKGIVLLDDDYDYISLDAKHVDLMSRSLRVLSIGEHTRLGLNGQCERAFEELRFLHISCDDVLPIQLSKSSRLGFLIVLFKRRAEFTINLPDTSRLQYLEARASYDWTALFHINGHLSLVEELKLINIHIDNFETRKFSCLKILTLYDFKFKTLPECFGNLSSLQELHMERCSNLERLPENFGKLSSLQKLHMKGCFKLERLPESFGNLSFLQKLYMQQCSTLERLPESFGNLSSLQELWMQNSSMLERLPQSFGNLSSLNKLDMDYCSKLERLPESFGNLYSLQKLYMQKCSKLERLPESFGNLSSLEELWMQNSSMLERLPQSFGNISFLNKLDMDYCSKLERLPESFGNLFSLQKLYMQNCSMLERLPESFGNLYSLQELWIQNSSKLERLPESFGNLSSLQDLWMQKSSMLERLPESFGNLSSLNKLDMDYCSMLEILPQSFGNLSSLQELWMQSSSMLESLPESFGNLSSLQELRMQNCSTLERLPESFGNLSSLQKLYMQNCSMLERLPESFGNLSSLNRLEMDDCSKLERLPESFGNLFSLRELRLQKSSMLERLPETFGNLSSLNKLDMDYCSMLERLPESFGNLSSLQELCMQNSSMLERLPESFGNLSFLQELRMQSSPMLKKLPDSFGNLFSLQDLHMEWCSKLERLPDSFGNLSSLQKLHMEECSKLEILPESFGNLSCLQELWMQTSSMLETLPESFGNLSSLNKLDMDYCSMLGRLPESFGNLSSLQELCMRSSSMLERLPESFGNLSSLNKLHMDYCSKLERLPTSFGNLSSLQELRIQNTSMLERLPESFGNLSSLQELLMRNSSMLERLPESFGNLSSLKKLYMDYCSKLDRLPGSFGNLSSLQELWMQNSSMLERLPESFGNLSSLQKLYMQNCSKLERLPESFGNLSSLNKLDMDFCSKLESLPESFGNLSSLRRLHMECSKLETLPESVGNLSSLQGLRMQNSFMLERLPESFGSLSSLQEFWIQNSSKLERLPESFGNLSSLNKLDMDYCSNLERLPESFGNLSSLQKLYMQNCSKLERLPESFGNLSSLQELYMEECFRLDRLPQALYRLSCLQKLEIDGCKNMCSLFDNFGQLKYLKFLNIRNCKELKRLSHDVTCPTSLAAVKAYGCAQLEAKALDSLVEIKSLMFLEMGESPMLIKRWEEIQQHRPLIGAALRFEEGKYPYGEIMSTMFFNSGSRILHIDGEGQLVEVASSSFPDVGVKVALLLTARSLSGELRHKLLNVASLKYQIIYVDVDVEGEAEAEGSGWVEERERRIRKVLLQLPEGSRVWTSPFHKSRLLFAYSLWHFTGFAVESATDTSLVGTSVVVDEEGRRKLSHPLEMIFGQDGGSGRIDLGSLFSPLSQAWEWMVDDF